MVTPNVSVIVCTYKRAQYLENCLQSIFDQNYENIEVILVAKDLDENGKASLKKYENLSIVIQDQKSIGVSAARNLGIKKATGDIIAFIDDDAIADSKWIENLVKKYKDPEVGGVGGLIIDASSNSPWLYDGYIDKFGTTKKGDKINNKDGWYRTLIGCNMSFRKKILDELNGFDENIIFYHEEPDLCVRILKKGYMIELEPTARVTHYLGEGPNRKKGVYYRCLNRLYFSFKNFGDEIPKQKIILNDLKLLPFDLIDVFRSLQVENVKYVILARIQQYKKFWR